uniref:Vps72/YL1 C-terminal domain-containing protein n=1 Tax=Haptolina brevifila TaxID=156173 RepID=A0A7S2E2B1_9EUKA|eukprot:CAMPEP_0174723666 /NCGR_PEP_ID=MMETSP1094-20130205/41564_1 /TAXON_ID=156173 /ORGANISM="Chrysochromulina brevifilum, Strain UTEX LB 985" /LENGTH=722 /DNA_ID=CAMNT_0015924751 /DNA_START=70 /DNA_END=2238 /DNA_ORIENTATION=+
MTQAGAGAIRFWGFSEPLDLFAESPPPPPPAPAVDGEPQAAPPLLRALMVAPGDVRHVLRSMAAEARRAHEEHRAPRAAEYAIYEREPEVLARHMLIISIALDFALPRRERAELLLEVWGNLQLREKTAAYVASRGVELKNMLANEEGPLAALIDTSALKSRDRDALEAVFRSWGEDVEFDIVRLHDERLRAFYKERYDVRKNVLDWDYTMELLPIASIVHKIHFREFRMEGLAFEVRDSSYSAPNRTLAAMVSGREKGSSVMRRGFWGDIANGPWAATHGVRCEETRLTNKKSDRHIKSSCDIAYFNVLSWLSEIETGVPFTLKEEDIADFEYAGSVAAGGLAKGFLSGKGKGKPLEALVEEVEDAIVEVVDEEAAAAEAAAAKRAEESKAKKTTATKMSALAPWKLKLLGGDWVDVQRKPRHQKAFNVVTIGTHVAFVMGSERLNGLLQPRASVLLETGKFLVEIRKDNRKQYAAKLVLVAKRLGWTLRDLEEESIDGVEQGDIAFAYDAETADALSAAARKPSSTAETQEADASAPLRELTMSAEAGQQDADGSAAAPEAAARTTAEDIGCLQITGGGKAEDVVTPGAESAGPTPPPLTNVAVNAGSKAQVDASGGKVCAITGQPAKYRDPISGLPYADLAAFRELRKLYPDPKKVAEEEAAAAKGAEKAAVSEGGGEGDGGGGEGGEREGGSDEARLPPAERPIVISAGFSRRVNKIA